MAASGLHISISAEPIAHIGGLTISNSIATSLVVSVLLILVALAVNSQLKPAGKPTGIQNIFEFLIEALYNLVQSITGSVEKTKRFFPLIATFFLFILFNNWLGLLPGVGTIGFTEKVEVAQEVQDHSTSPVTTEAPAGTESISEAINQETAADETHNIAAADPLHTTSTEEVSVTHDEVAVTEGSTQLETATEAHGADSEHEPAFVPYFRAGTADLNTTLALALISMFAVQVFGVSYQKLGYFTKFLNFSNPIMFFVGILETISEIGKVVSFAFRLFGNIFAGEVLLAVIGFLVPIIAPIPFYGLEVFVGLIQALVFALLSTVLFNVATLGHDDH